MVLDPGGNGLHLDDLRASQPTWHQEIKMGSHSKRTASDEGMFGIPDKVPLGQIRAQERCYDPLLQRYRDPDTEVREREREEHARVRHLNRAKDLQIVRDQHLYDPITHGNRLGPLADLDTMGMPKGLPRPFQPMRCPGATNAGYVNVFSKWDSMADQAAGHVSGCLPNSDGLYHNLNIVSNLPASAHQLHHWQGPRARTNKLQRAPQSRKVPHWSVKDIDIITNKYLRNHEARTALDKELTLKEATAKYHSENHFHPVNGVMTDARSEDRLITLDRALEVVNSDKKEAMIPVTYKNSETQFYNAISHEVTDAVRVRQLDIAADERVERFKSRHRHDHNIHVQDQKHDHIMNARSMARVAPERHEDVVKRGYDIVSNARFGSGVSAKIQPDSFAPKRMSPWERAMLAKSASVPDLARGATQPQRAVTAPSPKLGASRPRGNAGGTLTCPARLPRATSAPHLSPAASRPTIAPVAPAIPGSEVGAVFSRMV